MEDIVKQPLKPIFDNVPEKLLGVLFSVEDGVRFTNVPPVKDNTYFSLVELSMFIVDKEGKDIAKFVAEKQFYFKATIPESEAVEIIYKCYLETIAEYNSYIRKLNKSVFLTHKFQGESREIILNNIIASLRFNSLN